MTISSVPRRRALLHALLVLALMTFAGSACSRPSPVEGRWSATDGREVVHWEFTRSGDFTMSDSRETIAGKYELTGEDTMKVQAGDNPARTLNFQVDGERLTIRKVDVPNDPPLTLTSNDRS